MSSRDHAPAFRHIVALAFIHEGEPDVTYLDCDILSEHEDMRTALMAYLRAEFEDPSLISESKEGVFSVVDPMYGGSVTRQYKLKS